MPEIDRNSDIPIFKQIYEKLYGEITSGVYDGSDKLPSEKELKIRFGVERNTVRNALKLLADKKIIVKVPGYGTKIAAANHGENRNILFITQQSSPQNDSNNYFNLELIDGLDKMLSPLNYNLVFKSSSGDFNLTDAVRSTDPAAVIFDSYNQKDLYGAVKNLNIPCVSINHYTPAVTSVVSNNFDSSYRVVEMLAEAGHKRIAFIKGKENNQTTVELLGGIQSYYMQKNMRLDKKYIIPGQWHFNSGFAAGEKILAMKPDERPTAVFAFNDDMAFGCLSCFEKRGVSVPEDISLVGFGKSEHYASIFRSITTVDINIDAIIKYSVWYLAASIQKNTPPVCVKIQIDTFIRDNGTVRNINK